MKTWKQALDHWSISKKLHRIIEFNEIIRLKAYTDINTKLIVESKNNFGNMFFKMMKNNAVFRKIMENVKKNVETSSFQQLIK